MNSNRKVLIIVENLPVPFDTRVWQEATTLAANGYTVSVICPKGKGYTQEEEFLQGVHIFRHDLPAEGNGAIGYAKEYGTALKEELRLAKRIYKEIGFDVIHGCNPPDDIYMVAQFFKNMVSSMSLTTMISARSFLRQSLEAPLACFIRARYGWKSRLTNIVPLHLLPMRAIKNRH